MKVHKYVFIGIILFLFALIGFALYVLIKDLNTTEPYKHSSPKNKVDIVFTWVKDTPEFIKEKNEWLQKEKDTYMQPSAIRYSDNEELKYGIRSIEKYFPYFNNIYIIAKDGQYPDFLKRDNPRIKVIKHSDIMPKDDLPTFNSRAIEMHLHRIPNLSDNYLYLNDDWMFLEHVDPSYFMDKNDKPYVYTSRRKIQRMSNINPKSNGFMCGLTFNSEILDNIGKKEERNEILHNPIMYNKTFDYEIEKYFKNYFHGNDTKNLFDKTSGAKFRRCDDLYLVSLIKPYLYKYWHNCEHKFDDQIIINSFNNPNQKLNNKFMCVENIDGNNFDKYTEFMTKLFPEKSSFEK